MANKPYIRVPITMTDKMINFMETMSMKSKVTGGRKLPNTAIVRAAVSVLMDLDVDASNIKTEEELKARILDAMTKYRPKAAAKKPRRK
jgi:hypothetical protein